MYQIRGIPIGGPLSGGVLHLVLSRLEHSADTRRSQRNHSIAAARYVDDTMLLSFTLCRGCLWKHLQEVYRGVVKFELDDDYEIVDDMAIFRYLDATCYWSFNGLVTSAKHENEFTSCLGTTCLSRGKH